MFCECGLKRHSQSRINFILNHPNENNLALLSIRLIRHDNDHNDPRRKDYNPFIYHPLSKSCCNVLILRHWDIHDVDEIADIADDTAFAMR